MKATEILNNVKELLNLSREEVKVEDVVVEEAVDLSTEEVIEAIEEEVEEVILAEEPKEEAIVDEVAEAPVANYATSEELSAVKTELLSMIKALIEDKSAADTKEVPQELSSQEEVELSEEAEEVVHSPEASVEKKKSLLSTPNRVLTTEERVNKMLFN
jgi:small-conductance mechanosensitive channel